MVGLFEQLKGSDPHVTTAEELEEMRNEWER